jgi:hypothetical protein
MKTLKEFKKESHINPKLIGATVRQFGDWESFTESAEDVVNYGINGGFGGFIYYTDTEAFTKRNRALILDMAKEMAESLGEGLFEMIAGFVCLKGYSAEEVAEGIYNSRSDHRTTIYNALAWYAGEEVCRSYCDMIDGYS